ncbi:50S ribosomal protein L19e [Candidatus Woesearchaeota archaeon]|nr:50S ribosomal protein L19e [Candidatus Woesearchaeota archaeon]
MKLLKTQKRIGASLLKCSPKRVILDNERAEDIREAITKEDVRDLIREGAITKVRARGSSKGRIRKAAAQMRKGRRVGHGSRKGSENARASTKLAWINGLRAQRLLLKDMRARSVIDKKTFRELYLKSKGGFFRSKRHIIIYLQERKSIA